MATYRGSKGTVTVGGAAVGELQSWSLNVSRPFIDTTAIGDNARTGVLDVPQGSGQLTANFDYGDAGQSDLIDALVTNTDPPPLAAVFQLDTGKTFSCNILPTSAGISAQRGSLITINISFEVDGPVTPAWT